MDITENLADASTQALALKKLKYFVDKMGLEDVKEMEKENLSVKDLPKLLRFELEKVLDITGNLFTLGFSFSIYMEGIYRNF